VPTVTSGHTDESVLTCTRSMLYCLLENNSVLLAHAQPSDRDQRTHTRDAPII